MISLSDGTTTIQLHPDLYWADENAWNKVEQTAQRTVTGALVVSSAAKVTGRPITLQPEDASSAWMPRSIVDQLRNWGEGPGKIMQLTIRGITRNVIFRHHEGVAVDATPIIHYSDVVDSDWYLVTLRFMEV